MKRIDHLVGATVSRIEVSRAGRIRIFFNTITDRGYSPDFNPLTVEIPREPKKRKEARRGSK